MIFRTIDNKLIEINKYHFKNDTLYYKKLMDIYKKYAPSYSLIKL